MRYVALLIAISATAWPAEPPREKPVINPPPAARDWAELAKLPDWSGVWNPKITDQDAQARTNMPPWSAKAAALPNNGDMRIAERIYLAASDILHVELEITAPKVLTKPWKTTRIYFRQRARKFDIVEGVCLEGYFAPGTDKDGNAIFVPVKHDVGGNRVPPE